MEMTYPIPEATSASVLNAFSQVSNCQNLVTVLLFSFLCLLQLVSIGMINVVVLFVTLGIGVYSNWFIAGTMLVCAIIMGEE